MDYSKYSMNELIDCYNNIDKDAHPENYQKLILEIEKRKPELEDMQKQEQQELVFSTENRLKLLSWLQIVTCVGFIVIFISVLIGSKESLVLIICAVMAVFNGVAGYRLLKRSSYGYELSYLNQILQVLTINTGTVLFAYTGLGSFIVGLEGELFIFKANFLRLDFSVLMGENLGQWFFGIDLIAIFFLGVLHSCRELGIDTKANK